MAEKTEGFTAGERAAMKERAAELRAEAKRAKAADKQAADLQALLDAIAAMPDDDRDIATGIHRIVTEVAPQLAPKTWYGMPAYADGEGKAVIFVQVSSKFGVRYSTLGFQDGAHLDDGTIWPTAYAVTALDAASEKRIADLVRQAVSA